MAPRRKGTPTAHTTIPAAPITEVEQQGNIPYRGYVDHGIPVAQDFAPEVDESEPNVDDLVTWQENEDREPAPIPVYTVPGPGESGVVHRMFRTWYENATTVTRMIAGRHDARTKIKITNRGATGDPDVWIGESFTVSPLNGYPIPAGTSVDLTSNREVFAVLDQAAVGPVALAVLEEYSVTE